QAVRDCAVRLSAVVRDAGSGSGDDAGVSEQRAVGGGREIALIALLVVLVAISLAQSWNRWLDPIIDTGRDLYIPEQIAHGTTLYRDIRYENPPLPRYLPGCL